MTPDEAPPTPLESAHFKKMRKRAIASAYAGFAIDNYAIFAPSVALVPAMSYFLVGVGPALTGLVSGLTLTVTLAGRPLGAFIFGWLADRVGRQRIGVITIAGFGTVTLLIACLPGAQHIGPAAIVLLLALRFLDGVFLGGEYTAATPLAVEYAPPHRRGLMGGIIQSSSSAGVAVLSFVTMMVIVYLPAGGLDSPYVQWGWRIVFVVGAIISWAVALFLRREVEDSAVQKQSQRVANPLKKLFTDPHSRRAFIQVLVIMTGVFFMINIGAGVTLPAVLTANSDLVSPQLFTVIGIFVSLLAIPSFIVAGHLSDHIGRKRAMLVGSIAGLLVGPICIYLVAGGVLPNPFAITIAAGIASWNYGLVAGIAPAYFNERFSTDVRSSGWGIGYSTAVLLPALFPFFVSWLTPLVGQGWAGGVLAGAGSLLVLVGLLLGPETRGIDLTAVGTDSVKVLASPNRPQ